jgi:hypothetical protein
MADNSTERLAELPMEKHGGLAWARTAEMADLHRGRGDVDACARWRKVMQAIEAARRPAG